MTVVSSKEFAINQDKYYDMAVNEDIAIQRGNNLFHLTCYIDEINTKERVYYEPDEDFYESITIDEFKIKAREVVENAYKRYIHEHNNLTESTCVSG